MQAWSDNQKSVKRKAELACLVAMKKVQEVVERKTHEKEKEEKTHAHTVATDWICEKVEGAAELEA